MTIRRGPLLLRRRLRAPPTLLRGRDRLAIPSLLWRQLLGLLSPAHLLRGKRLTLTPALLLLEWLLHGRLLRGLLGPLGQWRRRLAPTLLGLTLPAILHKGLL